MSDTVDAIARALTTALQRGAGDYAQALAQHWSDEPVDLSHEPPLPMDGPTTRSEMLEQRATIDEAFPALMSDFHYEDIEARVVGSIIYLFCEQRGTLADRQVIRSPLCTRLTIEGERIVKVVLEIDPEANAALTTAFEARMRLQ